MFRLLCADGSTYLFDTVRKDDKTGWMMGLEAAISVAEQCHKESTKLEIMELQNSKRSLSNSLSGGTLHFSFNAKKVRSSGQKKKFILSFDLYGFLYILNLFFFLISVSLEFIQN